VRGEVVFTVPEESSKVTRVEFMKPKEEFFKQFKVHPEIDKQQWRDTGALIAEDDETGFAPGSRIDAFRYKISSDEEVQPPFEFNIFSTKAAGGKQKISLELEYPDSSGSADQKPAEFKNITVLISVSDEPKLLKIDNSTTNLDQKSGTIVWMVESLNEANASALLNFYTTTDEATLFPLKVSFEYTGSSSSVSVFDV
jgi:hypothetical protein